MNTIRRSPELETRIANAMEEFHETGPLLLVELSDEVKRLREQVARLKQHVSPVLDIGPERAQSLVDALRA